MGKKSKNNNKNITTLKEKSASNDDENNANHRTTSRNDEQEQDTAMMKTVTKKSPIHHENSTMKTGGKGDKKMKKTTKKVNNNAETDATTATTAADTAGAVGTKTTTKKSSTTKPPPKTPVVVQSSNPMSFQNLKLKTKQSSSHTEGSLSSGIIQYIEQQGFTCMTPVQAATIPQLLSYKDVAVQAVTGSGKTLAFLIPVLELILQKTKGVTSTSTGAGGGGGGYKPKQIGALILSPTRELAQQTYKVTKELCKYCQQPEPLLLVGGGSGGGSNNSGGSGGSSRPVTVDIQMFTKLKSNIIVGTPGRVDDIFNRYSIIDTSELDILILDEADVLLNMGFTTTLTNILHRLPKMRRTGLFSATQQQQQSAAAGSTSSSTAAASSMKELIKRVGMRNPIWIDVAVVAKTTTNENTPTPNSTSNTVDSDPSSALTTASDSKTLLPTMGTSKTTASSLPTTTSTHESILKKQTHQVTPTSLSNYYIVSKLDEKMTRLVTFLQQHSNEKIIVFFLTCACVDFYGTALQILLNHKSIHPKKNKKIKNHQNQLSNSNIRIELLHGKMVQKRREKSMERFRAPLLSSALLSTSTNNNNTNTDQSMKTDHDDDDSDCEKNEIDDNDNDDDDDESSCSDSHQKPCETTSSCSSGIALFCTDVAARGLDVADVNWVVQFDAPQDPSFFVHRVGRAARAGREGSSLLFVSSKEESYIDLLRMRKIPIVPIPNTELCCSPDEDDDSNREIMVIDEKKKISTPDVTIDSKNDMDCDTKDTSTTTMKHKQSNNDRMIISGTNHTSLEDVLPKIRRLVMNDRDILEKGTKAFTSYIRAYKEHQCGFIFRFASLDLGLLATSFCLLRLPKMPELRDVVLKHKGKLPHFQGAGPEVDIFAIPYNDKSREVARQKRLLEIVKAGGKNAKEIKAEQRKVDKERKVVERRNIAIDKGRNPDKKRGRHAQLVDEWDDLAKEERLFKKLRKKQITEDEYNEQLHTLGK